MRPIALLLSVLALVPSAGTDPIRVPHAAGVEIDGRFQPGEWERASVFTLADGAELRLQHDGEHLYLGLRAGEEILGSLCLLRGDTVEVLHASHALARATYAREGESEQWALVRGFAYGMRETGDGEETRAKRAAYLAEQGWIASVTRRGDPAVREYRISRALLGEGPIRLAVAHLATGREPLEARGWPVRDDCAALELVRGETPERLRLRPPEWAELELAAPEGRG